MIFDVDQVDAANWQRESSSMTSGKYLCVRAFLRACVRACVCKNILMNVLQLLGWLIEKLPSSKKLPAEIHDCIPYLFASLEDRNADVRKKAQEAVLPFMIHTGYEVMARQASKAKVVCMKFVTATKT